MLVLGSIACLASAEASAEIQAGDEKLKLFGDFWTRVEQDWDSQDAAGVEREDRGRLRVRARLGLRYEPLPSWSFALRLRSGSETNHQGAYITVVDFQGNDTGNADFVVDQWYAAGKRGGFSGWVGRNTQPFWRQNEMLLDDDATLAGAAASWLREGRGGRFAAHAGYFSLPVGMRHFSGNLGGVQAVFDHGSPEQGFTIALGCFVFEADPDDPDGLLLLDGDGSRDYRILQAGAQGRLGVGGRPLTLGAELLRNVEDYSTTDPDPFTAANAGRTEGYVLQARYGPAARAGSWLVGYSYARIETFAVNSSYAQDDWVRWGTADEGRASDLKGHELRGLFRPAPGFEILARLYVAEAITSVEDGKRLRVDVGYQF